MTKGDWITYGVVALVVAAIIFLCVLALVDSLAERRYRMQRMQVGWLPDRADDDSRDRDGR